jgi:hypothetical protein
MRQWFRKDSCDRSDSSAASFPNAVACFEPCISFNQAGLKGLCVIPALTSEIANDLNDSLYARKFTYKHVDNGSLSIIAYDANPVPFQEPFRWMLTVIRKIIIADHCVVSPRSLAVALIATIGGDNEESV